MPTLLVFTVASLLSLACSAHAAADQSPALPEAVIDLRTIEGVRAVQGEWRYTDARIVDRENHAAGADNLPGPNVVPTKDIEPRLGTPGFADAPWQVVSADTLEQRRTHGLLSFGWYRFDLTIPERIGGFSASGSDVVFEVVADDYAEIWVNGSISLVLGQSGGTLIKGWNAPNRVTIARDARPGDRVQLALCVANGPLSRPPANYVWIRSATLDFYKHDAGLASIPEPVETTITRLDPALDQIIAPGTRAERLASGFSFLEGPVWVPRSEGNRPGSGGPGGYLLFSDPNKNVIHRWDPATGEVSIYRTKSGYTGVGGPNIGEYHQPGSNGLALDPQGRLIICEHGNRRVTRLEPNGSITVLADRFEGKRLNSPNDVVSRSDGAIFFTDPPFGLPKVYDDPRKELSTSGVFCIREGVLTRVTDELKGPNGLAFSPDEKFLYVDNWDELRKVVMRYEVARDGTLSNAKVLIDLTDMPGEICLDGLKTDTRGNIYLSAPGGLRIFSPEGHALGLIATPELPANFAFGDDDCSTLYLAARTGLYRLKLLLPGFRGSPRS